MNPLHDSNPTTYTVYFNDGSVKTGLSYLESCELFDSRKQTGVVSVAPTNAYNTHSK